MNVKVDEAILAGRLAPPVKSLKLKSDKFFKLADGCKFSIVCPEEGAAELVASCAKQFWRVAAKVAVAEGDCPEAVEGYSIKIAASTVKIAAKTLQGVRYAMFTLRQLAESERGVAKSDAGGILPCVHIDDEPDCAFRGIHFCFFPPPETEYFEIEREIRLAAYYKFNYVVLEPWGSLRYPSHPEFSFPGHSLAPGEWRRLVKLAKDLGVTPIPQLNIFGHAAAARSVTGKHALLDFHPEFAPLFEPDGWCWCLSNPETRTFLDDLVGDLLDIFENPPFFHLGCDEADAAGSCALCRHADYAALLTDHLLHFGALLKKRGARPMVWHDMFVQRGEERWKGYVANGTPDTIAILDKLPKDFVICDWRYNYCGDDLNGVEPTWATLRHFIDKGFDTLGCPWFEARNTKGFGKAIEKYNAFGMLETTWHYNRGYHMFEEFFIAGWAAWNPNSEAPNSRLAAGHPSFNAHVRQINHDMGATTYEEFGEYPYQVHGPFYHEPGC